MGGIIIECYEIIALKLNLRTERGEWEHDAHFKRSTWCSG